MVYRPDRYSRVFSKGLDTISVFLAYQLLDECAGHVYTSRHPRPSPELAIDGPPGVGNPFDIGVGGLKRGEGVEVVRIDVGHLQAMTR